MFSPTELPQAPEDMGNYAPETRSKILRDAVAHHNATDPQAKILIVDLNGLENHLKNKEIDEEYTQSRYSLIVQQQNHFTTVDIDKSRKPYSCIILDAAQDVRADEIYDLASKNKYEVIYPVDFTMGKGRVQYDRYSCSLFALDFCRQLTDTAPDFHDTLLKVNNIHWDHLPPSFLSNLQSITMLEKYIKKMDETYPDKLTNPLDTKYNGESFRERTQKYISTYPDSHDPSKRVTRNNSISLVLFDQIVHQQGEEYRVSLNSQKIDRGIKPIKTEENVYPSQKIKHELALLEKSEEPTPLKEETEVMGDFIITITSVD